MSIVFCVMACSLGLYCCEPSLQITEMIEPETEATSAVIFLHGAGGNGLQIREEIESHMSNFSLFSKTRWIFPTAKAIKSYPFPWYGQVLNIWFSFSSLYESNYIYNSSEMENSAEQIERIINEQVASGIPLKNICLVGYSSGGMMSIYFGYGYNKNLGCIGAISSFISSDSHIYEDLPILQNNSNVRHTPLFMYGGGLDFLVLPTFVKDTAEKLQLFGIPVTLISTWSGSHNINTYSLECLFQFIKESIL